MDQQSYRLWMMQALAGFLDNKVNPDDFGGKPQMNYLIEDRNLINILKQKIVEHNLNDEEKYILKDALSVLEPKEEKYILDLFKDFKKEDLFLIHGDCYYLNCLYNEKKKKLFFIDYEYSTLNPFVSDIANIANETVFDYSVNNSPYFSYNPQNYPTDNNLREMIRALLTFWDNKSLNIKSKTSIEFEMKLKISEEFHEIDSERIEKNLLLVKKAAVTNNYYFLLWCFRD